MLLIVYPCGRMPLRMPGRDWWCWVFGDFCWTLAGPLSQRSYRSSLCLISVRLIVVYALCYLVVQGCLPVIFRRIAELEASVVMLRRRLVVALGKDKAAAPGKVCVCPFACMCIVWTSMVSSACGPGTMVELRRMLLGGVCSDKH
jgi:hypothetical protein